MIQAHYRPRLDDVLLLDAAKRSEAFSAITFPAAEAESVIEQIAGALDLAPLARNLANGTRVPMPALTAWNAV